MDGGHEAVVFPVRQRRLSALLSGCLPSVCVRRVQERRINGVGTVQPFRHARRAGCPSRARLDGRPGVGNVPKHRTGQTPLRRGAFNGREECPATTTAATTVSSMILSELLRPNSRPGQACFHGKNNSRQSHFPLWIGKNHDSRLFYKVIEIPTDQ